MNCPFCNATNNDDASICHACGRALSKTDEKDISWVEEVDFSQGIEWDKEELDELIPNISDIIDQKAPKAAVQQDEEPKVSAPKEEQQTEKENEQDVPVLIVPPEESASKELHSPEDDELEEIPREVRSLRGTLFFVLGTCVFLVGLLILFFFWKPLGEEQSAGGIYSSVITVPTTIYYETTQMPTTQEAIVSEEEEEEETAADRVESEVMTADTEAPTPMSTTEEAEEAGSIESTEITVTFGQAGDSVIGVEIIDYDKKLAVVAEYRGTDASVVLPAQMESYRIIGIEPGAFEGNETIMSLVIPEGIETIGENCFKGCTQLTDIVMPDSLISIGDGAMDYMPVFTIYSHAGTFAQEFAQRYQVNWIELSE